MTHSSKGKRRKRLVSFQILLFIKWVKLCRYAKAIHDTRRPGAQAPELGGLGGVAAGSCGALEGAVAQQVGEVRINRSTYQVK
jgi:hypothetical protein